MMKFIIISFLSLFILETSFSQQAVTQVTEALKIGDVTKVAKHFDRIVDITIGKEQTTYSKSQAEAVLKNFFEQQSVTGFSIKHKGSPDDKSSVFLIGTLNTKLDNFRIYLYFKKRSKEFYLQEIRIE